MSDGITDMYREQEESERAEVFLNTFAMYLIKKMNPDKKLIEIAMKAGCTSRKLLGHFGWTGKEHEKTCKNKLTQCMNKLRSGDIKEWTLLIQIWLRRLYCDKNWDELLAISPFKGHAIASVYRNWGRVNVGTGLDNILWEKAKISGMDNEGLAVFKIEDVKILPSEKEREREGR